MNRKTILIAIVAVIAIFVAYKLLSKPTPEKGVWVNNKISASYQNGAINEPIGEMPSEAEIFIDASGSMKPYFRADGTNMINTISEIVNLNQNGTQIYFLNNPKPYKGLVKNIITDVNNQPNESATTFHDFFGDAACKIDTANTLIYLVTDGIMSVGNGDMSKALVELRGKITNALKDHDNLAGAVFRYEGEYKGDYWNSKNQRITSRECPKLKEQIRRPYYVIVLGRKEAMRWLQSIPANDLNNPQEYFMGIHDYNGHTNTTLAYGDSAKIQDMNSDISLILELPSCLKDIDVSKVKVMNGDNTLPINVSKEGLRLTAIIPPTQTLRPEKDGRIRITFIAKNEIPDTWTNTWNTDSDIAGPDETTTYGLKYLVTGMFNGLEGNQEMLKAYFIYNRQ